MDITLTVTLSKEVMELITQLAFTHPRETVAVDKKVIEKPKSVKKDATSETVKPSEAPAILGGEEAPPPVETAKMTVVEVRALVGEKTKGKPENREKLKTILTSYGAGSVTDLKPEFYSEFTEKVNAL